MSDNLKSKLNDAACQDSVANIASFSCQLYMKYREVTIPAAVWQAATFPFHMGHNNAVTNISIQSRTEMLVALATLTGRMDNLTSENKTVQYPQLTSTNVVNYINRPTSLENMCYASFFCTYDSKQRNSKRWLSHRIQCQNNNFIIKRDKLLSFRHYKSFNIDCNAFAEMFLYLRWRSVLNFFPNDFIAHKFPHPMDYCFAPHHGKDSNLQHIQNNKQMLKPFVNLLQFSFENRKQTKHNRSWINANINQGKNESNTIQIQNDLLSVERGIDHDSCDEEHDDDAEITFDDNSNNDFDIGTQRKVIAKNLINYTQFVKEWEGKQWNTQSMPNTSNSISRDSLAQHVKGLNKQ